MTKENLTAEELRQVLKYDPETGAFIWVKAGRRYGKQAGHHRSDGYFDIRIGDFLYRAHRLAWLYMTGSWPDKHIDHKDRDPANTRWNNLRQATPGQNRQNQKTRKDSKSQFKGVQLHEHGLWRARLMVEGKRVQIGYFKTPEAAYKARLEAEKIHFTHSPVCEPQSACLDAPDHKGDVV